MKYVIYFLFIPFFLSFSNQQAKNHSDNNLIIDSSWQKKNISYVLNISLPNSSIFNKTGILNASFGEGKLGLYGVDYFDTVIVGC
jgi:hypothetical protein